MSEQSANKSRKSGLGTVSTLTPSRYSDLTVVMSTGLTFFRLQIIFRSHLIVDLMMTMCLTLYDTHIFACKICEQFIDQREEIEYMLLSLGTEVHSRFNNVFIRMYHMFLTTTDSGCCGCRTT